MRGGDHILLGEERHRRFGLWRWLFLAGVALLALHFAVWPYSFNVILTELNHGKSGFRLETMDAEKLSSGPVRNYMSRSSRIVVPRPNSFTMASCIWLVPEAGDYRLELYCRDQGGVFIDDQPVLAVSGVAGIRHNRALRHLEEGPHLLVMLLTNDGVGEMSLKVAPPGEAISKLIPSEQLFFVELGNIRQWFFVITYAQWFLWGGVLLISLSLLLWRLKSGRPKNWEYGS